MRIHCTGCEHVADLDRLDAVEGGFGFRCPACGSVNVLAPAAGVSTSPAASAPTVGASPPPERRPPASATGDPTAPDPTDEPPSADPAEPPGPPPGTVECPKCQHWQAEGDRACHRCGLMFAYAATGRARLPGDPLAGHPAADAIRKRWAALAAELDDTAGHHAFIGLCAESDLLEYAGFCYRNLARGRQEDPRIAAYRRRVLDAAMARVGRVEQRVDAETRRLRGLVLLLVAAVIVFILAFGYYLLTRYQVTRQIEGRVAPAADHLANRGGPRHHADMIACPVESRGS